MESPAIGTDVAAIIESGEKQTSREFPAMGTIGTIGSLAKPEPVVQRAAVPARALPLLGAGA